MVRQRPAIYPTERAKHGEWVTTEVRYPDHPDEAYLALLDRELGPNGRVAATIAESLGGVIVRLQANGDHDYAVEVDDDRERFTQFASARDRFMDEVRMSVRRAGGDDV